MTSHGTEPDQLHKRSERQTIRMKIAKTICASVAILTTLVWPTCWQTNAVTQTSPPRGTFKVTLNGFRVNHESDDDILEGDGRGDEIFITANVWSIFSDQTAHALPGIQTAVMGDTRG